MSVTVFVFAVVVVSTLVVVAVVLFSVIVPAGGLQATIDVVVSMGSTIIDFNIKNTGYGYNVGHILTLPITGAIGIPTTSNANFNEFKLEVLEADYDVFTGWSVGQLQVLDNFSELFDGVRKSFPITLDGEVLSIQAKRGSLIQFKILFLCLLMIFYRFLEKDMNLVVVVR